MRQFTIFGNPIAQSKSPIIQMAFAKQFGMSDFQYSRTLAPVDGFADALAEFLAQGGQGGNVTAPFKEDAFRQCQRLTPRAQAAGAVNTLKLEADGILLGDNTDGAGLVADILRISAIKDKRVLVLGAGGAVRGVILPLAGESPASITIANRTAQKAEQLAADFKSVLALPVQGCGLADLQSQFDIVINGTSSSLSGEALAISPAIFTPTTLAYDMSYGKRETGFMALARSAGVQTCMEGIGMLVFQAVEAFEVWHGVRPNGAPILDALLTGDLK